MEIIAKHLYARSSAQKIRLVANLIRNKKIFKALEILNFTRKKASFLIKKVLNSAIANAKNNNKIYIDTLRISKIFINQGPSMSRIFPRAKGRSDKILKRTCHIIIILSN